MALKKEIILVPKLADVKIDTTNIKKELLMLQRDINKNMPLKLSLSADIDQSVGRLKSDLAKQIQPQLDNVLKLSVGAESINTAKSVKLGSVDSTNIKVLTEEAARVQKVNQEYSQLMAKLKEINKIELKLARLDVERDIAQIAELNNQLKNVKEQYQTLYSGVIEDPIAKQILSQKQLVSLESEREKGINAVNVALAHQADVVNKLKQKEDLESVLNQNSIEKNKKSIEGLVSEISKAKTNWSALTGDSKFMADINALEGKLRVLMLSDTVDPTQVTLLRKEWGILKNQIAEAGLQTKNFGDRVSETFGRLSAYLVNVALFGTLTSAFRNAIQSIKDIDLSMTELKKVTEETDSTYIKFLEGAALRAQKLGATISDVITATADFARLGYSIQQAEHLSDAAIIYKHVGDGIKDISDASNSIISTMKAFDIKTEDSMRIVDAFNEVGNNFAISSKGIGDAFLRSASALSAANNTMEESIGLFVAANNVIQDPDVVGTAIKTIAMRLRNTAGELEELGEDASGAADSVTKLQTQLLNLTGGKIDIMLDPQTFKSTYQILTELSTVWNDLTDTAQADITRLVAGVRQGNVMSALMSGMSEGVTATTVAMNSLGSATKENDVYLNSIQGKTDKLTATFQSLSNSLIDSGLIKGFLDLSNGLLSILSTGDATIGKLIAITASITALSAALKSTSAINIGNKISESIKDIGKLKIPSFNLPMDYHRIRILPQSTTKRSVRCVA